jgi:hypothetical protein
MLPWSTVRYQQKDSIQSARKFCKEQQAQRQLGWIQLYNPQPYKLKLFYLRLLSSNFFRSITATIDVPIKVADQYNHKSPTDPDNSAGARDRAGFIDAPEINAIKNISNPTLLIAIPLKPLNPFVWTTANMTAN